MIVDSSAIVAVFFREPGYDDVIAALVATELAGVGAPTLVETSIVLSARLGRDARGLVERFAAQFQLETVSFGHDHWRIAHGAWRKFGKGRHPARLNLGDCMSYATAKLAARPLLCTGKDFAKTDLELVAFGQTPDRR